MSAQRGNPREPGFHWRSLGTPGRVNASTAFLIRFLKTTVKERGFARISEDVETTIWCLRETIRVAELAVTHRLGQMRRLLMHEKHKTWKRGFGFDRIETAAEIDEKRSRTSTSPVPNPFLSRHGNSYTPSYTGRIHSGNESGCGRLADGNHYLATRVVTV